jgi:hypothetical protein
MVRSVSGKENSENIFRRERVVVWSVAVSERLDVNRTKVVRILDGLN